MLELININKDYKLDSTNKVEALKDINIEFESSGFVSILGPSGCGKTTLLNVIGGLDHYNSGDLIIENISTKNFSNYDWDVYRNNRIGFVFQSYNLIPHLSLLENVEMPLILNGESKSDRVKKAKEALKIVGLEKEVNKKPNQLSGGQMQRVAIARAIVNNPEIILADEPTGALDTKTSIVVMNILKEISKTKLVIMVTHNENIAKKYSNRIISMLDGKIINDSINIPQKEDIVDVLTEKVNQNLTKKTKKTSMSYLTSLRISFKNVLTKKGRTILTAVASSVGIIGVGLVLSISSGFSGYIDRVQAATASNSPITISSVSYSYKVNDDLPDFEKFPTDNNLYVYDDTKTLVTSIAHINKLDSNFLNYLDDIANDPKYSSSLASKLINYRDFDINLIAKNTSKSEEGKEFDNYQLVNPYDKVSSSITSGIANITGLPNYIFHELYGDENYILTSYDVLQGEFPRNEIIYEEDGTMVFESALILDSYNRLSKTTLEDLGLFSKHELENKEKISFDDIIGKEYGFILNSDLYKKEEAATATYPSKTQTLKIKTSEDNIISIPVVTSEKTMYQFKEKLSNYSYRKDVYENSKLKVKITGILRVKQDSILDYMPASLGYTEVLKDFILQDNFNNDIGKLSKNNLVIGDFSQLNTILTNMNYFKFFNTYFGTNLEVPSWAESLMVPTLEQFKTAFNDIFTGYAIFQQKQALDDEVDPELADYEFIPNFNYVYTTQTGFLTQIVKVGADLKLSQEKEDKLNSLYDLDFINNPIQALTQVYEILSDSDILVYLLSQMNNFQNINTIILFPSSLTSKSLLLEYLDNYNINKAEEDKIIYTDLIGTLTDSLGEVINIISWVLIAFASISLIVSCVMAGIITYNSVIERTKEIGILRAVGARKKDVGRLFKSENLIIGFVSGLFGVIITYILQVPINVIINSLFPDYNIGSIANISFIFAILLILLSAFLSYISGLIPARMAAKKDPVVALRSE